MYYEMDTIGLKTLLDFLLCRHFIKTRFSTQFIDKLFNLIDLLILRIYS